MRIVCSVIVLLCAFGCSQSDAPVRTGSNALQDSSARTLANLVFVDALSPGYQHPLVCGPNRDFPAGEELVFKNIESNIFIHAVFPEEIETPAEHQGNYLLHGHFQGITNRTCYLRKVPPEDYRYFVVSSWESRE